METFDEIYERHHRDALVETILELSDVPTDYAERTAFIFGVRAAVDAFMDNLTE